MFDLWLTELADISTDCLDRPSLCDLAAGSGRLRAALDGLDSRLAAAVSALGDGGAGPSTMFRSATHCSLREADRQVRRAQGLAEMPTAAAALTAGEITAEHVDTLLHAAEATSPAAVERSRLVRDAKCRPADLHAKEVRDWTRRAQTPETAETHQRRCREARRGIIFDSRSSMTVLHGELDPITGAKVRTALDRRCNELFNADGGRDGAAQMRSAEQRRADAIAELILGIDHSADARGDRDESGGRRQGRSRPGPVRTQLVVIAHADGTAEIPGTGPIPASELAKLVCESDLYGLVFTTDGQPLWHGTRIRLADDNQWRALIARDRGCVICAARPALCEAHHIVHARPPTNGPTDIDNLVLLCRHHHHLHHDLSHSLRQRTNGAWQLVPPEQPGASQPRAGP